MILTIQRASEERNFAEKRGDFAQNFNERGGFSEFLREILIAEKKKCPKRLLHANTLEDCPPLNMIDLGSSSSMPRQGSMIL